MSLGTSPCCSAAPACQGPLLRAQAAHTTLRPCLQTQMLLLLIHLRTYRKEIHLQPLLKPSAFLFHLSQTIPLLKPTKTKSQEESSNISRKLSPWDPYLKPFCSPNSKMETMLFVDLQGCNQLNVLKCFVAMRN